MWTPLILLCMVADPTDCATPLAPAARTEELCVDSISEALSRVEVPPTMFIAGAQCFYWGNTA